MKTAIKNILFPVLSAVLLIVVEKVVEKLLEDTGKGKAEPPGPGASAVNP
ncbi:hypothetical protein EDD80_104223 [Anseongella ginsenosidimutans]|uniref:Uncharacterized protein n=1 Tax=Anseongella ginsenosidimutans TaxID=496056 RepID=A0A4R3KS39_9SPHI|nr:hypothetical protein [Anseongella ginsenosidimutans]TCS87872.1 hypothetical protein EDD80_104223 [Anseongella ginsenosidimutans]